ncbi:MAG TPA: hypothetical protein PKZ51_10205 [Saprospiraceae bacterium]|nr:hypothetical protein [Saprospiraceae bacterium]
MISWVLNKEMRGYQKLRFFLAENQNRFTHHLNINTFMRINVTIFLALVTTFLWAQKTDKPAEISADLFNVLSFRSIGPAVTSGRVIDFAVNPSNPNEYFVAAACGGVWKTTNRGTTYSPVFDGQGSYSIGCVTIDPSNSNIVWVGSGENNNQRSVAYGDGVYKSVENYKPRNDLLTGIRRARFLFNRVCDHRPFQFKYCLGRLRRKQQPALSSLW